VRTSTRARRTPGPLRTIRSSTRRGVGGVVKKPHLPTDSPHMHPEAEFRVARTRIHAVDLPGTLRWLADRINDRRRATVIFCTASTIVEAQNDPDLRTALSSAELVTPDGMPLVWLGRRKFGSQVGRVYGPDLMAAFFEEQPREVRHFFYGGAPTVNARLIEALSQRYPDLVVAGSLAPQVGDATQVRLDDVASINEARPDIVWVGLGHPKQEIWMHTHRDLLDAPIIAGVGAAFDYLSGAKREAPAWMKRSGLQWLHRLASEPRRLWRRYLVGNTRFIALVVRDFATQRGSR
jgi:N-acetylglucosaminyldiphosphoundecaprenol N-acetyl-beta-D-mannosaminyltransferase